MAVKWQDSLHIAVLNFWYPHGLEAIFQNKNSLEVLPAGTLYVGTAHSRGQAWHVLGSVVLFAAQQAPVQVLKVPSVNAL